MSDFDLDLQTVEEELDEEPATDERDGGEPGEDADRQVILGRLDGTTPDEEWIETATGGDTLVLNVEGDVNELAAGFARDVHEAGGELMEFRGFLVVTPPGVSIDASRLR